MQLGFFPEPLPDEPLYSLVARYKEACGYGSHRDAVKDVFGSDSVSAVVDLPSHLADLEGRCPWQDMSVETVISKHTAAPYYYFFASDSRRVRLRAALSSARPPSGPAVIGAMAVRVKNPRFLRYCPLCACDDRSTHGVAYWHRVHQLPGVVVCQVHDVGLIDSPVLRATRRTRYAFHSLEIVLQPKTTGATIKKSVPPTAQLIAHDSAWLLSQRDIPPQLNLVRAALQARFKLMGWLTHSGRIHARVFYAAWNEKYPAVFRAALCCGIDDLEDPLVYVRSLLYGGRKTVHPLLALLIVRLAGESPESLYATAYALAGGENQPTLSAQCINPICPEVKTSRATKARQSGGTTKAIHVHCTKCGMQYRKYETEAKAVRVVSRGWLWEERLRELAARRELSLRRIATQLGVDPMTIKRHANRLRLVVPWSAPDTARATRIVDTQIMESMRSEWLRLQVANPDLSRTDLRKRAAALWAWLYRNDRLWLVENQPTKKQKLTQRERVDWRERDKQLSLELVLCVGDILSNSDRPIRVTRTEVARRLGNRELFRRNLVRNLPRTARAARRMVESAQQFAMRRIDLCIAQYRASGVIPQRWEFVRRAGLGAKSAAECAASVDRAMQILQRGRRN